MPDYSRFNVLQRKGKFSLLDQHTGWCWTQISRYPIVLAMMQHILNHNLEFKSDEYKRIRRLEGPEWERELTESCASGS